MEVLSQAAAAAAVHVAAPVEPVPSVENRESNDAGVNDTTPMIDRQIITERGRVYEYVLETKTGEKIPTDAVLQFVCSVGRVQHRWETLAAFHDRGCIICTHLNALRSRHGDPYIDTTTPTCRLGQQYLDFRCSQDHKFVVNASKPIHQCPVCKIELTLWQRFGKGSLRVDKESVYIDIHSNLRIHCDQLRHVNGCENQLCVAIKNKRVASPTGYARDCKNFVRCGSDFYATAQQLLYIHADYIFNCNGLHLGETSDMGRKKNFVSPGPAKIIRMLECLYGERFDYSAHMYGLRFTAFNPRHGIAVIHSAEKHVSSAEIARKWCAERGYTFIYMQASPDQGYDRAKTIANYILMELVRAGKLTSPEFAKERHKDLPEEQRFRNIVSLYHTMVQSTIHNHDAQKIFLPRR